MRSFLAVISFILLSLLPTACGDGSKYRWDRLGGKADNINRNLDSCYHGGNILTGGKPLLASLDSLASASKDDPRLQSRLYYWKSVEAQKSVSDSFQFYLGEAQRLTDSVRQPYQYHRISLLASSSTSDYIERYKRLKQAIAYFAKAKDEYMLVTAYGYLGHFYHSLEDYDNFYKCVQEVDHLYSKLGADSMVLRNRMNYGLYHMLTGDTIAAVKIFNDLIKNPIVARDSFFLGQLYANISYLEIDPQKMEKAIEISPAYQRDPFAKGTLQMAMAKMYERRSEFRSTDSLLKDLEPLIMNYGDNLSKKFYYETKAKREEKAGNHLEALNYIKKSIECIDTISSEEMRGKIERLSHRNELEMIEKERIREHQINLERNITIAVVMLFIVTTIFFYMRSRHRKLTIQHMLTQQKVDNLNRSLEENKRKIVTMGLSMTERDNLLNEVLLTIESMADEGTISFEAKRKMANGIKMSEENMKELEDFRQVYEKVHPDFLRRLISTYPDVSEGDVRLALYIAIGLTNKQIANIMRIQPDSIKKSRYRLRQRMHLTTEESLDKILREML